jgi:hypothetical protein
MGFVAGAGVLPVVGVGMGAAGAGVIRVAGGIRVAGVAA